MSVTGAEGLRYQSSHDQGSVTYTLLARCFTAMAALLPFNPHARFHIIPHERQYFYISFIHQNVVFLKFVYCIEVLPRI